MLDKNLQFIDKLFTSLSGDMRQTTRRQREGEFEPCHSLTGATQFNRAFCRATI